MKHGHWWKKQNKQSLEDIRLARIHIHIHKTCQRCLWAKINQSYISNRTARLRARRFIRNPETINVFVIEKKLRKSCLFLFKGWRLSWTFFAQKGRGVYETQQTMVSSTALSQGCWIRSRIPRLRRLKIAYTYRLLC